MPKLTSRWRHLRQLVHRGLWTILLGLWGLFGLLATIRDNFIPIENRAAWDTLRVVPHWTLGIWISVFLAILVVGGFEGSYRVRREEEEARRPDSEALARYRASDPRIEVEKIESHEYNPYHISVDARVENPGESTILRSWTLSVARDTGAEVPGRLLSEDGWICYSYELTSDGRTGRVYNNSTPLRSGGTGEALLHFHFKEPLCALRLDERTRYTVSCRTINGIRVEGTMTGAPSAPDCRRLLDDAITMDHHLRLEPDPARTNLDRLHMARTMFDELVEAGATGSADARKSLFHIGMYLVLLSLEHHGMTEAYVRDFDRFRDGCVRGGIRKLGYAGDG